MMSYWINAVHKPIMMSPSLPPVFWLSSERRKTKEIELLEIATIEEGKQKKLTLFMLLET